VSLTLLDSVSVIFGALSPPFSCYLAVLRNLGLVWVAFRIEMVLHDKARKFVPTSHSLLVVYPVLVSEVKHADWPLRVAIESSHDVVVSKVYIAAQQAGVVFCFLCLFCSQL
jgi:hypothetical protein